MNSCSNKDNSPKGIKIEWLDSLEGDFSFKDKWSYPPGVYLNRFGQLGFDGYYCAECDLMKDSTGRIYQDSLTAFYKIIDTTHQFHSIECDAWCYEYGGTDYIKVVRKTKDTLHCSTPFNVGTHCSLCFEIYEGMCLPGIDMRSVFANRTASGGSTVFPYTNGSIKMDKKLFQKGIMKAEFNINFKNTTDSLHDPAMFWKGRVYAPIEKENDLFKLLPFFRGF